MPAAARPALPLALQLTRLYYELRAEVTMPDSCNDVSVMAPLMVLEAASESPLGKSTASGTALVADATCKVRTSVDVTSDGQRKVSWRAGLGAEGLGPSGACRAQACRHVGMYLIGMKAHHLLR